MAQRETRLYGSAAILQRLLKALIWGGVVVYLFYILIEGRPSHYSLAAEPPAAVSLADFSRRNDLHERNEVSVVGRIDSLDGVPVTEDGTTEQLFIFFAPDSGLDDTMVRAAVLIEPEELDIYLKELAEYPDENRVKINGRALDPPTHSRPAEAAIRERGLTLSDQFIYITPWLGDRRDPLDHGPWLDVALIGICSLFVLYHLFMALRWHRNDRAVMAMLSDQQIAMYKRSMRENRNLGDILYLAVLAVVVIAFAVSRYR